MLSVRPDLPRGFWDCNAHDLYRLFSGPTLIHLPGRRPEPLFVSVLLHGNEYTGLIAVQALLRQYQGQALPRALSLLIGNVHAARIGRRYLPGEPDFNRIWIPGRDPEHIMTQQVLDEMARRRVFASVDVHNNSGNNPHYAIVAYDRAADLELARRFARTVVYSTYPDTTCTVAFGRVCPAVTVEAGLPGEPEGISQVVRYLESCLRIDRLDGQIRGDVELFHSVAVVKVPRSCSYGFEGEDVDLQLSRDIERYNFREIEPGTRLARVRDPANLCLEVRRDNGDRATDEYLTVAAGEVRVLRAVMPAMLTTDRDSIGMDCLCYFMERYRRPSGSEV